MPALIRLEGGGGIRQGNVQVAVSQAGGISPHRTGIRGLKLGGGGIGLRPVRLGRGLRRLLYGRGGTGLAPFPLGTVRRIGPA